MNKKFWDLIAAAHAQSDAVMDQKCVLISQSISELSREDAQSFANVFDDMMDKAYSWALWGAAYVIDGGCGDDSFSDFRASLISRGKDSFVAVLANPDSLAEDQYDEDLWFYEGFQYAVSEGVEKNLGAPYARRHAHPEEPSGEPWEEEPEQLKMKYPKLWAKFEYIWMPSQPLAAEQKKSWWKFW